MKKQEPLVSVIVPCLNSEKFLPRCLKSIREQTYKNIELIVVDNRKTTDKTREIAKEYGAIVLVYGPERSAQVNFGVAKAKGEYVYKVDSDFELDPKVIEQCVEEASKGCDAVVVHNSPDVTVSWIARIRKFEVDMYKYDLTHSSARFVKKEVYEAIHGFNEKITAGEDYDFQNKLNRARYKTGFVEAEALHLGEPTSFRKHMRKFYDYGKDFVNYREENSNEASKQLGFFRTVYFKHWRQLLMHPIRTTTFAAYNTCKYVAGGTGYIVNRINMTLPRGNNGQ